MAETQPILQLGERIGFQVREGTCKAGCTYCYERKPFLGIIKRAETALWSSGCTPTDLNSLTNRRLAVLVEQTPELQKLAEMSIEQFRLYFRLLIEAGIKEAFFLGSEPTDHSNFREILDLASEMGIDLMTYSSGMGLEKLDHPAVKHIVLHINDGSESGFRKRAPTPEFMDRINGFLRKGKHIDCRVNFSSGKGNKTGWIFDLREQDLVFNFYDNVPDEYRAQIPLKYSFSAETGDKEMPTPPAAIESLKQSVPEFLGFIDEFRRRYPHTPMSSERPLFRCSFSKEEWTRYQAEGGLRSRCKQEFTVYQSGLALCPPTRDGLPSNHVETVDQLRDTVNRMREQFTELLRLPSFPECEDCQLRLNLECQGGCGSYKVARREEKQTVCV